MIGVIASVIAGVILKEYVMLIAPIVFLVSSKNRDAGLVVYLLYILYSSSKVVAVNLYTYGDLINALVFAFSGVLLLEDVLRRSVKVKKSEVIPVLFILLGLALPESFLAGGVLYFLMMKPDWRAALPLVGVIIAFALIRENLSGLGASGQTVVFGSFALFTLAVAFLMKDLKRVEMFK
jgi:multisubunit Na+/H+ antiporter MnhG subunit